MDASDATTNHDSMSTTSFRQWKHSIGRLLRRATSQSPPRATRPVPEQRALPDADCYTPRFAPHLCDAEFAVLYRAAEPYTLVSPDRAYVLYTLARQAFSSDGETWECGTYRGGTAMIVAPFARTLRLFDTFTGLPEVDVKLDRLPKGEFADTSAASVGSRVDADIRVGVIPTTFWGLEDRNISLAHIDVDLYRSVLDCCEFIYPRVHGFMVFDDYGFKSCPGARKAVDEFFADKPEHPLVLPTGQAVVFKP